MSDYEDDYDDDLPSVSLSQSIGEKSELEMPPASEVASLRAREEAAERALKDLRESYATPRVLTLSRSASQGSSSEEGEAALSAAVSALQVTDARPGARGARAERLQLLVAMREHLPEDREFLDAYIQVLKDKQEAVDVVTEKVLQGITSALSSGWSGRVPGACAWLLCVALTSPRALRPRRALHALLDSSTSAPHVHVLARAVRAALQGDAEQLVAAHDAVRSGARAGADALAAALLAHAVQHVLQPDAQDSQEMKPTLDALSPLSGARISEIRLSWRRLPARAQLLLLRAAGRALAAAPAHAHAHAHVTSHTGTSDTPHTNETTETPHTNETSETVHTIETMETQVSLKTEEGQRIRTEGGQGAGDAGAAEGGAALLAALAQPLPRSSAFHLERQQVLTNVSKLQLLFRARFNPDSEFDFEHLENSTCEFETPTKSTPTKAETSKLDTQKMDVPKLKLQMETPTPVKKEMTQMKIDSFMKQSPIKQEKEKDDGEHSPERKRTKREGRAVKLTLKDALRHK